MRLLSLLAAILALNGAALAGPAADTGADMGAEAAGHTASGIPAGPRLFIDDLGRRVLIPARPRRIVSTDDVFVTVPLLELGAPLVGSQGRPARKGSPWLRSARVLTGLDFANTDIAFLGAEPIDVEAVVASRPDLIITLTTRPVPHEQLQSIAPTLVFDPDRHRPRALYRRFAQAIGREAEVDRLEAQYQAGLDLLAVLLPEPLSVSLFDGLDSGKIALHATYGALGEVIQDAGLRQPPLIAAVPAMQSLDLSPEILPELDADLIIGTYRDDRGDSPEMAKAALAKIYPDYCQLLTACKNGRMYFLPRDIARSSTYSARMLVIGFLLGVIPASPAP